MYYESLFNELNVSDSSIVTTIIIMIIIIIIMIIIIIIIIIIISKVEVPGMQLMISAQMYLSLGK